MGLIFFSKMTHKIKSYEFISRDEDFFEAVIRDDEIDLLTEMDGEERIVFTFCIEDIDDLIEMLNKIRDNYYENLQDSPTR